MFQSFEPLMADVNGTKEQNLIDTLHLLDE
jgi:hypothetical protein